MNAKTIIHELRNHAPFTALGTVSGIVIMILVVYAQLPKNVASGLFWTFHPLHVFLSALVTTAMYRLHSKGGLTRILFVGYTGSVGIATLSDSLIPFLGEWILHLPNRGIHLGFIEKWWLVNPLALAGIAWGVLYPRTKFFHAGHVLLSTWASLFHIIMALGTELDITILLLIAVFLFLAVWIPCCTSDILYPLLWISKNPSNAEEPHRLAVGGTS